MLQFNYTIQILFTGLVNGKDKAEAKALLFKSFEDLDVSEKEIIKFEEVK